MQRAIPPDRGSKPDASEREASRSESVGDLHLAADNFAGAIEAYGLALAELGPDDAPVR